MAQLSQWDQQFLSPEHQQEVLGLKAQWETADAATRVSLNNRAEAIRGLYNYQGGIDGSQYVYTGTGAPQAPVIPEWQSQYTGVADDLFNKAMNPGSYDRSYLDMINESLSSLQNRQFSYDPNTDPAYQAFRERALAAGDTAYANNLGGLSAATGGRPNTWAGAVASQARNQYVLQAETAVIEFEDRAYQRFRDETSDMYQFISVLDSLDTKAYNQFRDKIGDTKDLFNMVMDLDDRSFEQYKFKVDQTWKTFNAELDAYKMALDEKQIQIGNALDRVNMLGYVDNETSTVLGLPVGTLSQGARERAEDYEDYIKKSQIDIEKYAKQKAIDYGYDMKLIAARASSGGGGGGGGDLTNYQPTKTDAKERDTLVSGFEKLVTSDDFKRLTYEESRTKVDDYIEKIINDCNDGIINAWVADEALGAIRNSDVYQHFEKIDSMYIENPSPVNEIRERLDPSVLGGYNYITKQDSLMNDRGFDRMRSL